MRSPILAIACGFVLVSASAALADQAQPPTAQPVSAVSTASDSNPVICHTFVHEGSLVRAKACHSEHEWEAIRLRDQRDITEFRDRALTMEPK